MWFRNRYLDKYVVDTSGLTREREVAACRAALALVRPEVGRFQLIVNWPEGDNSIPDDVRQAALVFVPRENHYEMTKGWITDISDRVWQAFVTLAPYTLSADVWTEEMEWLLDIDDEGRSLVVRVLPERLQKFKESVPGARVVPLKEWVRERRRVPRNERWSAS